MKTLNLNSEAHIPVVGFGTWQLKGDTCRRAVEQALDIGYRHIDTADVYSNHMEVAKAIKNSGIPRTELFITTKVWHSKLRRDDVISSAKRFLEELGIDYIDLLLIHWPNKAIPISETLKAFDELKKEEIIKAIGVSNFTIRHLEEALQTGIEITNNQVEFHPSLNQEVLKKYCDKQHIVMTAYSPLAQGADLKIPIVKDLATKYHTTPSQIVLNWILSKGMVAIPRSSNPERIKDNFQAVDWELEADDITQLDMLNIDYRIVNPPFSEFDEK